MEQNQNDCSLVSAQRTDTTPELRNLKQNSNNCSKISNRRTYENTSKLKNMQHNQNNSPVLTKRSDNTSELNTSDCNQNDNPAAKLIVISETFSCIICSGLFSDRQELKQHLDAEHSSKPLFQDENQRLYLEMALFEVEPPNVAHEKPAVIEAQTDRATVDRISGETPAASEHPDIANKDVEDITSVSQNKSLNTVNERSESAASIQVCENTGCSSTVNGSPEETMIVDVDEQTNVTSEGSPEDTIIVDQPGQTNDTSEGTPCSSSNTYSRSPSQLEDDRKTYSCSICHVAFESKKYIIHHLRKCHSLLKNEGEVKARRETLRSKNKGNPLELCPASNAQPAEEDVKARRDTLRSKNKEKPAAKVGSQSALYCCLLCPMSFTNLKRIRQHVLHTHVTKTGEGGSIKFRSRGLCCDVCGLYVEDMERLWAHREVLHADAAPYELAEAENCVRHLRLCQLCLKYFNRARFQEHECLVTSEVALNAAIDNRLRTAMTTMCDICAMCFHWKWSWRHHRLSAHKNMPDIDWNTVQSVVPQFCCKICLKGFIEESVFTSHDCQHKDEPPSDVKQFSCDICQRRFRRHYEVWNHKKVRHMGMPAPKRTVKATGGRPKTKCPMCDLVFRTSKMALAHIHSVHNLILDTPFLCTDCDKTFKSLSTLHMHRRLYHGSQETEEEARQICEEAMLIEGDVVMYRCNSCARIFYSTFDYLKHYHWHTAERKFICRVCGEKFISAKRLYNHKKLRHDVDTFICDVCGEVYRVRQRFVEHFAKTHANRDQLNRSKSVCEKCGSLFVGHCATCRLRETPKGKLRYLYTCDICSGKYPTKSVLEDHMNSHTGEKPYSCLICAKTFGKRKALWRHGKTVHSGMLWPCVFCPMQLSSEKTLKLHVRLHLTKPPVEMQRRKLSKRKQAELGLLEK